MQNRARISSLVKKLITRTLINERQKVPKESDTSAQRQSLICQHSLSVPGVEVYDKVSAVLPEQSPSKAIDRISVTFKAIQDVELVTGLAFHGPGYVIKLGHYTDDPGISIESGAKLRSLIAGMIPAGIVGIKFVTKGIGATDRTRTFTFGSFNGQVAKES